MSRPAPATADFARRVLRWQRSHGRHDLPWQGTRDPYPVWLSEVMLQQTQVSTVQAYFDPFLRRFPSLRRLAGAELDEVFALWSGLGYYRRARLLHQCAQQIMSEHDGVFPVSAQELQKLPGIGRSTAAAIASICFGERVAILDGNVKRLLARYLAFDKDLSQARHERELWDRAQDLLPGVRSRDAMPAYTQALMDLGALVCLARQPRCEVCPLRLSCAGRATGDPLRFPAKSRPVARRGETLWLLLVRNAKGEFWLVKRPVSGIWAGLYCLPAFDSLDALRLAVNARDREYLLEGRGFVHVLTHRDLTLQPVTLAQSRSGAPLKEGAWHSRQSLALLGLPAPIRTLLENQA